MISQQPRNPKSAVQRLVDVFMPAGYPHSVTEDYLEYQIYDSLQAFASSIAGLLASRAVLEGTYTTNQVRFIQARLRTEQALHPATAPDGEDTHASANTPQA